MRRLVPAVLAFALIAAACGDESTADAGKECTDGRQCEGWCEAPPGAEDQEERPIVGSCSDRTHASCMRMVLDGEFAVACE